MRIAKPFAWLPRERFMSQGFRAYQEYNDSGHKPDDESTVGGAGEAQRTRDFDMMCEDIDLFCEHHLDLASEASLQRKRQMQRRLAFVQDLWNDADRFDAVVVSGRYLKLCNLTEWLSDYDERAWARVKNEILTACKVAPEA
jgi:hypothetical protein